MRGRTLSALFGAAIMITGAIAFAAEDGVAPSGLAGVTFPIAELGSCGDKAACRVYCDDAAHMTECVAFAESHGLMNTEEASRAKRFAETIVAGSGPGGCTSPRACQEYCENVAHLDACMTFAEKNKFTGPEYAQGKKIHAYIKGGGSMPGGCTSKASCQAYCEDFNHAEECGAFAEAAGITEMGDDREHGTPPMKDGPKGPRGDMMPTREQMAKLATLAKNGETPGKCTSKTSCETYCRDGAHMEECMAFAEKMGFLSKEEAARARTFIEKGGPGGCKSEAACHAYCNAPENRESCFQFAKENGLIPPEEIERMKEGMVRMRQGLEQAPPEVRECLKSSLGETVIEDIQSGKLVPGPDIGERTRTCFEKFGGAHDPSTVMRQAPPEVRACLNEKVGLTFEEITKREPTPEIADAFRVCFQQTQFRGEGGLGSGAEGMRQGPNPEMLQGILRSAPPEVAACFKEKLGDELEKISSGTSMPTPEIEGKMRICFESFRPMGAPNEAMHRDGGTTGTMPPSGPRMEPPIQGGVVGGNIPPEVAQCIKEKLGEGEAAKLMTTGPTPETQSIVRACFEQFGKPSVGTMPAGMVPPPSMAPQPGVPGSMPPSGSMGGWTSGLPPLVQSCLKAKFGEDMFVKIGMQPPTPEIEMAIRACFTTQSPMPAGGTIPMDGQMPPPPTDAGTIPLPSDPTTQTSILKKALFGAVVAAFGNIGR